MLKRIAHRGPDDSDHWRVGDHAWLGHARLSIVDLDGGRQPLGDPGDWALVCNGEIYNHADLRARLGEDAFATASDSESALALLRAHGPRALDRLQGMWALCAAARDGRFVAARDRLGIKPLYWAKQDGSVSFASELRAFPEAAQPAVEAFPPGCWWTPQDGLVRFADAVPRVEARRRDWGSADSADERDAEKATREVLADSVRRHLMADVDVGVFLSGGLDSSIVAAVAADAYAAAGRRLKTFAVGTQDSPDLAAARDAAAFLGTEHHEAVFDARQAIEALDRVVGSVESFDASLIRSAVPNWFLSELASRHVKAVLTGEGADELFAGYGYYHRAHATPDELDRELARTLGELHGLNLQRCDRVTMAHGLEARVPFLDSEVIAHAMSLPPRMKALDPDGMEKGHLRRAFDGWLPERLLWRRKVQFGTGSGAEGLLSPYWDEHLDDAELAAAQREFDADGDHGAGGPGLRSKEELAYYRAFRRALPAVRPEAVLTRFATS
jgi:asparagine synthase (glutamine-hydrolysing)